MLEETFLRLQPSEGIVSEMASRIFAAYVSAGQLTTANEDELIERSIAIAIKMAQKVDRAIESDNESGEQ